MSASYSTIPHFSPTFEEVDVTELESLANTSPDKDQMVHQNSPIFQSIMQALVKALGERPECNALFDDANQVVTRHEAVHLGIATQTERGLYVPVKHVEAKDIWETAKEMVRVTSATRDGKAASDDLSGCNIYHYKSGSNGWTWTTPIINKPEVGILGVHNAKETPVVINGRIEIRRIMRLSSSWDHRVVDGFDRASCVQVLKSLLEHPATIFM